MKDYLKGAEDQHKTASVKGKVVTMNHVTLFDNGEKKYMKTIVDLSNESEEDILLNAATNYLIQVLRPRAIKPKKPTEIDETKVMRPCDFPASKVVGVDKREREVRYWESKGIPRGKAEDIADHPEKYQDVFKKVFG